MKKIKSVQGDTLDLICWRYYGRTAGTFEAVLTVNPHLSEQDPILELGTEIILPEITLQEQVTKTINLWD
ncbi:tail protein X [Acinetobacter sp. TGL-Y2]|uniref:tail protein X n=1 Tax=Acinetobacter sp. TGL-Y2 TaxID=1407071 RepID=UPI0019083DAF|nr:tail protein X [Acinetobacter sp. TGL-Y2]MBJ9370556.1 tail protein X [Acinetobacter sp. TGL-Y2]